MRFGRRKVVMGICATRCTRSGIPSVLPHLSRVSVHFTAARTLNLSQLINETIIYRTNCCEWCYECISAVERSFMVVASLPSRHGQVDLEVRRRNLRRFVPENSFSLTDLKKQHARRPVPCREGRFGRALKPLTFDMERRADAKMMTHACGAECRFTGLTFLPTVIAVSPTGIAVSPTGIAVSPTGISLSK